MRPVDPSGCATRRRGLTSVALTVLLLPPAVATPAHAASLMVYTNPGNPTFPVPGPGGGRCRGRANASCTLTVTSVTLLKISVGAGGAGGGLREGVYRTKAGAWGGSSGITTGTTVRAGSGGGDGGKGSLGDNTGGVGGREQLGELRGDRVHHHPRCERRHRRQWCPQRRRRCGWRTWRGGAVRVRGRHRERWERSRRRCVGGYTGDVGGNGCLVIRY
ncbi:hypothetical protein [Saccharothrix yanglingensis]|uniref:hypothetical protein n=1 Tax=Saccharothrix yanglingensis TaxID=659496 RepID=UPI0027D33FB5|nr:hypothetical protein [Saccharothrix yanglingensis]